MQYVEAYFVEFAPTIIHEKNFAYVESSKFCMLVDHEKNALGAGYIVEFIHDATENYYEGGILLVGIAIISSFISMCLKSGSYTCVTFLCLVIIVPISCLLTKSLCIGSGLDLNVLVIFFMMLSLCFNSYPFCEHR